MEKQAEELCAQVRVVLRACSALLGALSIFTVLFSCPEVADFL
jgi:hypothetical protein